MSEPYLIAHLVRGEPAFDIAIQIKIGEEDGWIIPTSGHRARPFWHCKLEGDTNSILGGWAYHQDEYTGGRFKDYPPLAAPEGWPDHYSINAPRKQIETINLEELGL